MSSSGRNWQREYKVTGTHYSSKTLVQLLYPSSSDRKEEHPLKQSLIRRLSINETNGNLWHEEEKQGNISDAELEKQLRSGRYECCVAELQDDKSFVLVGYRLYRIEEIEEQDLEQDDPQSSDELLLNVTIEGAKYLIPIDTGVRVRGDKIDEAKIDTEDQKISNFLDKVPQQVGKSVQGRLLITINSSSVIQDSLYELALYVQRSTSFWYGGFFGSKKESALRQIAERIRLTDSMTSKEAEEYFLDIVYAAFQTRGSGHRLEGDEIIPTKGGDAFVRQVFYKGGNFTHLRCCFRYLPYYTVSNESKDADKKEFDAIYRQLMTAAKLKEEHTIKGFCCPNDYQKVNPNQQPVNSENRYIRRLASS